MGDAEDGDNSGQHAHTHQQTEHDLDLQRRLQIPGNANRPQGKHEIGKGSNRSLKDTPVGSNGATVTIARKLAIPQSRDRATLSIGQDDLYDVNDCEEGTQRVQSDASFVCGRALDLEHKRDHRVFGKGGGGEAEENADPQPMNGGPNVIDVEANESLDVVAQPVLHSDSEADGAHEAEDSAYDGPDEVPSPLAIGVAGGISAETDRNDRDGGQGPGDDEDQGTLAANCRVIRGSGHDAVERAASLVEDPILQVVELEGVKDGHERYL